MCLGIIVYKVTQGPLTRGQIFLPPFSPLARECFFLLELESWPEGRFTIVARVLTSIYTLDAAVGVLTLYMCPEAGYVLVFLCVCFAR